MQTVRKVGIATAVISLLAALIFGTTQESVQRVTEPLGRTALGTFGIKEIAATQHIRYFVAPRDSPDWLQPRPLKGYVHAARSFLKRHRGHGFAVWLKGNQHGTERKSLKGAMREWRRHSLRMGMHKVILAKAFDDGFEIKGRKKDLDPAKWSPTAGTPAVDIVVGTLLHRHPGLRVLGIFSCRTTVYGGWSQHAWANAVDFGGTQTVLNAAAHDAVTLTHEGWLPASQVIWQGHELFTSRPIYDHTDHVHVSGAPLRSGTPPCVQ
jgi:hypothetical protein